MIKEIWTAKKKLSVGIYGITGCAGCQLSIIFNEDEILDIINLVDLKAFPFIKEVNPEEKFDCVFVEGLVADEGDLQTLKKIRQNSNFLIALGACAHTGCIPAYRNYTLKENYSHLLYQKVQELSDVNPSPLHEHVAVDYIIPGCPPDKHEILAFIKSIAKGKIPLRHSSPVCIECRKNGNACLLDKGKPCLGPITVGGCNAVCINGGFECWGCRGPTADMNFELLIKMLRDRGFSDSFIQDRLYTFAGITEEMITKNMNLNRLKQNTFFGEAIHG